MNRFKTKQSNGFTLLEMIMTILILGLVATILAPYFRAITSSPDPVIRQRAVSLAQSMMDEILAKRWDEASPVGGGVIVSSESPVGSRGLGASDPVASAALGREATELANDRSNWDDVDDFNGHTASDAFRDQNNNAFSLPGYSRSVQVDYVTSSASPMDRTTPVSAGSTDSKRIMVTVTAPNGETFTLVALACNI